MTRVSFFRMGFSMWLKLTAAWLTVFGVLILITGDWYSLGPALGGPIGWLLGIIGITLWEYRK